MTTSGNISSPRATGGGGFAFEHKVGGRFLGLLLLCGIPAIFSDCQVIEVGFQTGHLGWKTDDLLVTCSTRRNKNRRLAMQVKLRLTVSAKDPDCIKTFTGFWNDFKAKERFNPDLDALVLITQRGTNAILEGLGGLLDCARNSSHAKDFTHRLAAPGFLSAKAKDSSSAIKSILNSLNSTTPSDDEVWRFLKSIYLLNLDLDTSSAQDESWTKQALAQSVEGKSADAVVIAERTWLELVEMAVSCAARARSVKYNELPETLRRKHRPIQLPHTDFQSLQEHSALTLVDIRSTIGGDFRIPRTQILTQAIEALFESQLIVLSGAAGSGKSAVAKELVQWMSSDHVCISFRAEEFALSHIDQVLAPLTGNQFQTLLGAQERVLVHVESVERLLEHHTRDAFFDLLNIVAGNQNVRLLLTCRDYAEATVLNALVTPRGIPYCIVEVPPLSDSEVNLVVDQMPGLATLLANSNLKHLMRHPYYLDIATRLDWSIGQPDFPSNETAFRQRCWEEIIRRDSYSATNLPNRRENALIDLSIRRATDLRPFVPVDDSDGEALDELRKDGIVARSHEGLFAPAHDVMEDWAITAKIEALLASHEWQATPVANSIKGYPALRRVFRKWLTTALEDNSEYADQFVLSTYGDYTLPPYFRDDVLVSALLSSSASSFVKRQQGELLAADAQLLVRLIHLTRLACMKTPRWMADLPGLPSVLLEPDGHAWPAVLAATAEGLEKLLPRHIGSVIGLIEDWSRGACQSQRLPEGSDAFARIAYRLLDHLADHGSHELRKRVLKAIAGLPRADEARFLALLECASTGLRRDILSEDLAEILLTDINGYYVCRDFPEHVAQLALSWFRLSRAEVEKEIDVIPGVPIRAYSEISDESRFGLRDPFRLNSSSAIWGPFLSLLRLRPEVGVQLVIDLSNHTGTWYSERTSAEYSPDPPYRTSMTMSDGTKVDQWANKLLWSAYRGTPLMPSVVQSSLMALEHWLLDMCQAQENITPWIKTILRDSNNVMPTAVLASVCTAYPQLCGDMALTLLTSREAFQLDLDRKLQGPTGSPWFWPQHYIYRDERQKSDQLSHRQQDLENLARTLQLSGNADQVHTVIDSHIAAIPLAELRTDEDKLWRLALHRMDLRDWETVQSQVSTYDGAGADGETTMRLARVDADVLSHLQTYEPQTEPNYASINLAAWGLDKWREPDSRQYDGHWSEFLYAAMTLVHNPDEVPRFAKGAPGIIAAVCVRDHWNEINESEKNWCKERLISEVEQYCDSVDVFGQLLAGTLAWSMVPSFDADRYAANVLPQLLARHPADQGLLSAVTTAISHASAEVRYWAADGVGKHLHPSQDDVVIRCAGGIAMLGSLLGQPQKRKRFGHRPQEDPETHIRQSLRNVRMSVPQKSFQAEDHLLQHQFSSWEGRQCALPLLALLSHGPELDISRTFFGKAARYMAESWELKVQDTEATADIEFDSAVRNQLADFVLKLTPEAAIKCCQPIMDVIGKLPEKVSHFISTLVMKQDAADVQNRQTCFWDIWQAFADHIAQESQNWPLDREYDRGAKLVGEILFGGPWNQHTGLWRPIRGNETSIDNFVLKLPSTSPVVYAYTRYLYNIGESAMPRAFQTLRELLDAGNTEQLLSKGGTSHHIETLLQRSLYRQPSHLKSSPQLRTSVLQILDHLVEAGSSSAYKMRDDFVTPVR